MEPQRPTDLSILALVTPDERAGQLIATAKKLRADLGASLRILHVKAPANAIQQDNQFSAKKELYEYSRKIRETFRELVSDTTDTGAIELVYGNVRNSVLEAISDQSPQVILMGKRIRKAGGIIGDRLTEAVLDATSGSVLILDDTSDLGKFSAGIYAQGSEVDLGLWHSLLKAGAQNTRYFSIGNSGHQQTESDPNVQHFVFTEDADSLERVVAFASKTKTELFCIPRGVDKAVTRKLAKNLQGSVLVVQ